MLDVRTTTYCSAGASYAACRRGRCARQTGDHVPSCFKLLPRTINDNFIGANLIGDLSIGFLGICFDGFTRGASSNYAALRSSSRAMRTGSDLRDALSTAAGTAEGGGA
jgi:hypothetical protein